MGNKSIFRGECDRAEKAAWVKAAQLKGMNLNEFMVYSMNKIAKENGFPVIETPTPEKIKYPVWMNGLTLRAKEVLSKYDIHCPEKLCDELDDLTEDQWRSRDNCGLRIYNELRGFALLNLDWEYSE